MSTPDDAATEVRRERPADQAAVEALIERAFAQRAESELVRRLRSEADPSVSLVAHRDGTVAGHAFVSPMTLPALPDLAVFGLGPVAVNPPVQGSGIGSALVRRSITETRALGAAALFVLGDPAYYGRFGFSAAAERRLHCRYPGAESAFQVLELREHALADASGLALYHPAFDAV